MMIPRGIPFTVRQHMQRIERTTYGSKELFLGCTTKGNNASTSASFHTRCQAAAKTTTGVGGSVVDRSCYVHPLSQIVLEHLQNSRSTWVAEAGLDRGGLSLKEDGSFVLKFATSEKEGCFSRSEKVDRIWTTYDREEKKHWLAVHRGNLVGRYLLQDNMKPAWHSSKLSTPEKVQAAVDEMIRRINEHNRCGKETFR